MQITFSPISWVLQHENKILLHNLFQPIVNVCTGQQLVRTTKSFVYVKPSKRLIWGMSNSYYSHVAKLLPNDFHMHCWSDQRLWPYVQAWSVHTAFFRYRLELKFWVGLKVEKILKGSQDSIPSPSPSVKIQIMGGKVCLKCKGKPSLGDFNKLLFSKVCWTCPAMFCLITSSKLSLL